MTTAALPNVPSRPSPAPLSHSIPSDPRAPAHAGLGRPFEDHASTPGRPALRLSAASTCAVGLANVAAGVVLAGDVTAGRLAWPWLVAPVAAATLVLGGTLLLRASRLARHGLDAIDLRLGPIAACISERTPNAIDADDDAEAVEVEHASLVQILLVGVLAIAVLIGVTSFPSRVPWPQLVPALSLAWPALLRVVAVRRGREGRRELARRLRDRHCDAAMADLGRRR
jgi:hypothetical protein